MSAEPARGERLQIMLTKEEARALDDWRFARRMPTRADVPVNPSDVSERLNDRKIIATIFAGEAQKKWQGLFKEIFKPR